LSGKWQPFLARGKAKGLKRVASGLQLLSAYWYNSLARPYMNELSLSRSVLLLLLLFLIFAGLYYARPFLIPVAFAALFAMLLLPLAMWLEDKGLHRILSVLLSLMLLAAVFAGIVWLISWQVSDLAKDAHQIEQNLNKKIEEVRNYFSHSLGITRRQQDEFIHQQQATTGGGQLSGVLSRFLSGLGGFLTNLLLVIVYTFLFLYFKEHLKKFILLVVPRTQQDKAESTIHRCRLVAQKYITGLSMMIVSLWIMYGIGFTLVGVKNALFFAILCGLLEIVPFVGNLTGNLITVLMTIAQGGDMSMVIGIVVTYGVVQFLQTYLLEPLVVGAEVNIHPLFTIMGIVVGELLWGIPGMILAIPMLGIAKIICDNIEPLKPYGYLIGEEKKKKREKPKKQLVE
jgi:predicted PurR-regulated permease PerM